MIERRTTSAGVGACALRCMATHEEATPGSAQRSEVCRYSWDECGGRVRLARRERGIVMSGSEAARVLFGAASSYLEPRRVRAVRCARSRVYPLCVCMGAVCGVCGACGQDCPCDVFGGWLFSGRPLSLCLVVCGLSR
jgi:hypothetical protein